MASGAGVARTMARTATPSLQSAPTPLRPFSARQSRRTSFLGLLGLRRGPLRQDDQQAERDEGKHDRAREAVPALRRRVQGNQPEEGRQRELERVRRWPRGPRTLRSTTITFAAAATAKMTTMITGPACSAGLGAMSSGVGM